MGLHELAGKKAPRSLLENVPRLIADYYTVKVDAQKAPVAFGTSGHRGSAKNGTFNEEHILAICQAVVEYRQKAGISGPCFIGMDTHALSEAALITAVEVLAAHGVQIRLQKGRDYSPTPVISKAIISYNRGRKEGLADGIIITPSHNPPADGGFKYNPPHGGPADTAITGLIQKRANEILAGGVGQVPRLSFAKALALDSTKEVDLNGAYVDDLVKIIDFKPLLGCSLKLAVDPLGGSSLPVWQKIIEQYKLDLTIVNDAIDPTFSFMTVDKDGKIRMDCSSPWAMASLIAYREKFDLAFGNDPDSDRHGIVARSSGLMNPNHYLSAAIYYLFTHRPNWAKAAKVGKTLVSSSMINRVAAHLGRQVMEVPVGFKWFVPGLSSGEVAFGGEESAGASFLTLDGATWTTDKDGIILDLLAAEMTAVTGKDPGEIYADLTQQFGNPAYGRIDVPTTKAIKERLTHLSAADMQATSFAGENITAILTTAPGNGAPIGGLKVETENGWFAARPSGTEDIYKIYAESFKGPEHLTRIQKAAESLILDIAAKA